MSTTARSPRAVRAAVVVAVMGAAAAVGIPTVGAVSGELPREGEDCDLDALVACIPFCVVEPDRSEDQCTEEPGPVDEEEPTTTVAPTTTTAAPVTAAAPTPTTAAPTQVLGATQDIPAPAATSAPAAAPAAAPAPLRVTG